MIYFLDTNVIIDLFNGKSKVLAAFKNACFYGTVRIADLVYYEVLRGFEYSDARKQKVEFEAFAGRCGIEYMDKNTFMEAARQYAGLKRKGLMIEDDDILIGSFSIERNAVLVTNNVKHFSRLDGIQIENWAE